MGYYLLDHRPPRRANWYTSRRLPLRVIVMHVTAGIQDLDTLNDLSAENTARYAATTDRQVSWHSGSDADSFLHLLPPTYTAFHCVNYNSFTFGHEISKRDVTWRDEPAEWVTKTLTQAAACVGPVARKYGIPTVLLSKAQVDAGARGFTAHAFLDPSRRSDPGADFPWQRFFQMVNGPIPPVTPPDPPVFGPIVVTHYPEENMRSLSFTMPLDAGGNGWRDIDADPAKVVSFVVNAANPPEHGYGEGVDVSRLDVAGKARVVVANGHPKGAVGLTVWVAD